MSTVAHVGKVGIAVALIGWAMAGSGAHAEEVNEFELRLNVGSTLGSFSHIAWSPNSWSDPYRDDYYRGNAALFVSPEVRAIHRHWIYYGLQLFRVGFRADDGALRAADATGVRASVGFIRDQSLLRPWADLGPGLGITTGIRSSDPLFLREDPVTWLNLSVQLRVGADLVLAPNWSVGASVAAWAFSFGKSQSMPSSAATVQTFVATAALVYRFDPEPPEIETEN